MNDMPPQLYEFQKQALSSVPSRYILAWDTGTGKSFSALAHYERHAYPLKLLIVCPATKKEDWERDVQVWFQGKQLPEYAIYSYEKFSRNPTVAQFKKTGDNGVWRDFMKDNPLGNYAVIADECHRLAAATTGIGKAMFAVASKAKFFLGLSATPLPNGWISAANYFKIWGFTPNITAFKRRYCNIQTFKGWPEIVGYWREDELKQLWNGISSPLKKEDCLDLPPTVFIPVQLPAGKQYIQVLKERIFGDKFLDNPSALLHALRQSVVDNKIVWLDEFLEGVSGNVVIFYNYISEREAILAMLKKKHKNRRVFRQDGERHEVPAKGNWDELDRTITLAQYKSGATGVEMTYASNTVYFSPTYSFVEYEQSVGRTFRNGQNDKCTFYQLCCINTVERSIWKALAHKQDFDEKQWITENLEVE